jgi:biotin carboxyl carrier protein
MHYSLKIGEQFYEVEIKDLNARPVMVVVDGQSIEVWPEESLPANQVSPVAVTSKPETNSDVPCPPPPLPQAGNTSKCVSAPIPGVIVTINVKPGQTVKRGDELCMLEAMKMKNSIRAGWDGTIESISVAVGDQVRHGQTLIEFTS